MPGVLRELHHGLEFAYFATQFPKKTNLRSQNFVGSLISTCPRLLRSPGFISFGTATWNLIR